MLFLALACADPARVASPAPVPRLSLGSVDPVAPALAHEAAYAVDGFGHDPHTPVGPWAIFADGDGAAVLDEVHSRIVRFDAAGTRIGTVPIPSASTFDAVATEAGYGLLVWTKGDDAHWSTMEIDTDGALIAERRLDVDVPTAVVADGERLLVEERHAETVDPETGERFPGRPTGDGRYVRATRDDLHTVSLTWSDGDRDVRRVQLDVDRPVVNVVSLDAAADRVVVSLLLMEVTTEKELANPEIRVVEVDRTGHRGRELRFPAGDGTDAHRPFAVTADGAILHLRPTEAGVGIWRAP